MREKIVKKKLTSFGARFSSSRLTLPFLGVFIFIMMISCN